MTDTTEGWGGLDESPAARGEAAEAQYRLDMAFARTFATEPGRVVLTHLRAMTIEQPAWVPGQHHSQGYMREGQNSIVREIERRIRRAAEGPPNQETTNG